MKVKSILGRMTKPLTAMKMQYILPIALMAALFAGCNKAEVEIPGNNNEGLAEIKAQIVNTKTTYDDTGKFSWVANDRITVVVYNDGTTDASKLNVFDHYTYTNSTGAGETATFTGSTVNAPWHEYGVALYPNKNASTYNCLQEAGAYDTGFRVVVNQEIHPDLSNPLDVVPLIGRKNSNDVYQFKTAMGVLQVTVSNIPADAYYLYLQDPSGTFAFSGTFEVGNQDVINASDAVSPTGNAFMKTIAFTPAAAGETRTFYFPVPVGTIPAGTMLKMDKGYAGGYANIMTKTLKDPVTITANHVTPLKAVSAQKWVSLGAGKFIDDNGFYATSGTSSHVDVTIEQLQGSTKEFRVVNPYQAYIDANGKTSDVGTPDPYFYFTLKDEGYVDYAKYNTSLYYYGLWYGDQYGVFSVAPTTSGSYNKWNNVVLKSDASGNPLNVQIAPIYTKNSDNSVLANSSQNPKIEIVFPGSTEMLTIANYANGATVTYSTGDVNATINNSAITAVKVVAAASLADGVAALKAGGEMLTFTASGTQQFSGLANGNYRLVYKVETDGHGFTFKDGGDFTITNGVKVTLTESMMSPIATETSEGSVAGLVDGNTSTYWHSPWSVVGTYDSTYGIYVDIDLGAGNGLTNFKLRFCLRNCLNDHPDHVKIYASTDGTNWGSAVGEMSSIYSTYGQGNWTDFVNCVASTQSRYIRISILSTNGNNGNVSNLTSSGCTHMAEIELYSLD